MVLLFAVIVVGHVVLAMVVVVIVVAVIVDTSMFVPGGRGGELCVYGGRQRNAAYADKGRGTKVHI